MFFVRKHVGLVRSLFQISSRPSFDIIQRATMATHNDKTLTIESRVTLSDNNRMPYLGLGTWRSEPGQVQNIVREAILNHSYRHIDAAWIYQNENEVGNGIHEAIEQSHGKIKREDIFITTKLWNQHHAPADVEWAIRDSLQKLRLDYVDLYLIHWPVAFKNMKENVWSQSEDEKTRYFDENVSLVETWKAMEKLVDLKLTRSIGISNFNVAQIDEILHNARIKPVINQVELHPYFNQKDLKTYCAQHGIVLTSYCPLSNLNPSTGTDAKSSALHNPVIQELAQAKHKSPAQIIIRWHLQNGLTVIPKTVTPSRLAENANVYDFVLSEDEMQNIDELGVTFRKRMVNPPFAAPNSQPIFPN